MEKQPNSRMCFRDVFRVGHRPARGAIGLHLSFYTDDEGRCIARFRPRPEHQGYPGHLHGGLISTFLAEAMGLAREANGYLHRKAPWFQIKEDRQAAATSVYVTRSVRVVDNLKTILAPVLPHTAQRLACGASTWGTTGSSLARSRWWSTRKRRGATRR